jgi:hypothetical protein
MRAQLLAAPHLCILAGRQIEEIMKRFQILLFSVALFLLVSCGKSASPTIVPKLTQAVKITQEGYPAPQAVPDEANSYPVPTSSEGLSPDPTQDPKLGIVHGKMLLLGKPYTEGQIYLSEVIKDNQGTELVVGFDRTSVIRGALDGSGSFAIKNVPPGRYGVVLDKVSNAFLLMKPGKDESFIIDVVEGQNLDLGTLDYPNLPNGD